MKTFNKMSISFAKCMLAVISGVGVANAGEVTVKYQTFPSGAALDSNVTSACLTATAETFPGYEFVFWDVQGTISWSPTVTICAGTGKSVAIAWYLPTGGPPGPCPPIGCSVATFAYSMDHHEVLSTGTPIAMVSPNSPVVWTSPSTTVLTTNPLGESISANSALAFPPHAAEPFRYWQELGTTTVTPIGVVYRAAYNSTALVVAFYGPDPCQDQANELTVCVEDTPTICAPLGKLLAACEKLNRESN